jgi:hypothetical protein
MIDELCPAPDRGILAEILDQGLDPAGLFSTIAGRRRINRTERLTPL